MIIESVEGFIITMAYWPKKKDGKKRNQKVKNDATGGLRVLYWRG
jgi:hypothetical protein